MTKTQDRNLINQLKSIGINLTDTSKRNVQGFCPIHSPDGHPSFFFNLDSQLYQCFGCELKGKGINKLRFAITGEKSKINFVDAINLIKLGKVEKRLPSVQCAPIAIGNKGEKYLLGRGISRESIEKWGLMYSQDDNSIIIPLEKIGYVKRRITDKDYKYIPGTTITADLMGSSKYDEKSFNGAILVEGSFDAIYLHQLGFKTALAILHADISTQQIKVLKGLTSIIYILLDNDRGGIEATEKIVKKLRNEAFIIRRCSLPIGKDPNDCTKEEIEQALKNYRRINENYSYKNICQ